MVYDFDVIWKYCMSDDVCHLQFEFDLKVTNTALSEQKVMVTN